MIGRTLSHYRIIEKLGEGGMGCVYKARDTHLDRFVAVKVLPPENVADPERKRRFAQEAKAASSLNHPNIITIHDIDRSEGIDFIAMEYVAGKTLAELIPRRGKGMLLSRALKCAVQIADALARAHGAGIIHRDLKPSNVMVDEHGLVKVLDFGLAKLGEADGPEGETAETRTGPGAILGTAAYMSPEQAEGKPVDARSDIFSFGSVLYEMLTGERAFRGETTAATIAAILREDPKPISRLAAGLPSELERIAKRCLRKDPDHRFQHTDDLKVALEELTEELDSGALAGEAGTPPDRHRRKWVWVGAAVLTPLVVALAWFLIPSLRRSEIEMTVVPLTTFSGSESYPAFSPDGRQLAFAWNGEKEDNYDIYIQTIGSGGPLRRTTDPAPDIAPSWSPDGRHIAFLRRLSQGKLGVYLTPFLGGPERRLAEVSSPGRNISPSSPAWSADSRWLVVSDRHASEDPLSLFLLSVESGEMRRLTRPDAAQLDLAPAFAPGGRTLAFIRSAGLHAGSLELLEVAEDLTPTGEPREVPTGGLVTHMDWTQDGRELVFVREGRLWRVATSGHAQARRLDFAGEGVSQIDLSPKGARRIAYAHTTVDANIWSVETGGANAGQPRKLISSTRADQAPDFSPDGEKIALSSNRSGSFEIWVCDADGSNALRVTAFGGPFNGSPRWSPDGRQIVFDSLAAGNRDIYVVDATGGKPRALTTNPTQDRTPSWSHDGQWIYFSSDRGGDDQVWKMPARGGEAVQVTQDGGYTSFESPDGKTLYFMKDANSGPLFRLPLEGGSESQVLESVYRRAFAITESGIYFVPGPDESGRARLKFRDSSSGETRDIASLPQPPSPFGGLTVSPDGPTVLFTQNDIISTDLMLLENFP